MIITFFFLQIHHAGFNAHAERAFDFSNIFLNIPKAYRYFILFLTENKYSLISTHLSKIAHIAAGICVSIILVNIIIKKRLKTKEIIILLACLLIFPLSINGLFLIIHPESLGTMELYSFISIYILTAVIIDGMKMDGRLMCVFSNIIIGAFCITIICNIFIANKCWLELHMAYENMYAVYSSMVTSIQLTPGYDEKCKVAIIGEFESNPALERFKSSEDVEGITYSLLNAYSNTNFLRLYLNAHMSFASEDERNKLCELPVYSQMPVYPYYGSIQKIDDYIIVKAGDN